MNSYEFDPFLIDNIVEVNHDSLQILNRFIDLNPQLTSKTKDNLKMWLDPSFKVIQEHGLDSHSLILKLLKKKDWEELKNRFFEQITPGTAGIRGKLGVGSTRINEATIGMFAQAHANYLIDKSTEIRKGILIGGDSRIGSYDPEIKGPGYLQKMAAEIYAEAGIPVFISDKPLPTPVVSFAIGEVLFDSYLPVAAVINTASHNPSSDNGFKIYESGSHQVVNTQAKNDLQKEVKKITTFSMVKRASLENNWPETEDELVLAITNQGEYLIKTSKASIKIIDSNNIIKQYANKICQVRTFINKNISISDNLSEDDAFKFDTRISDSLEKEKIVITTLCGNGWVTTKTLLKRHGLIENVHFFGVPEEIKPDGAFPVGYNDVRGKPNPEYPENFYKGIELAKKVGAKYVFAVDPDSDRIGIGMIDNALESVREVFEKAVFFSGNEQLSIVAAFLGMVNNFDGNDVFIKTRVSSNLYTEIIKLIGAKLLHVLVGFKYFGQISNCFVTKILGKNDISRLDFSKLTHQERKKLYAKANVPRFIHGGEESMGQNMYDYVYDKDTPATIASFAEIIGYLALDCDSKDCLLRCLDKKNVVHDSESTSIFQRIGRDSYDLQKFLANLFKYFGIFNEDTKSFRFEGEKGNKIKIAVMDFFRNKSVSDWNRDGGVRNIKVAAKIDYLIKKDEQGKNIKRIIDGIESFDLSHLPSFEFPWIDGEADKNIDNADYIAFFMENGDEIHIRPSGTEPVIKVYLNLKEKLISSDDIDFTKAFNSVIARSFDFYSEIKDLIEKISSK